MIKLGKLRIDPVEYGSQGTAILGTRDSGKSYTATYLAERLFEAGIPFVAFDPIGIWRFLRIPGKGRGYPIVVAGGKEGDLPLTVASAPEIVRAAMRDGVSLVIDLFDINLSKADWRRIVTACVRVLLHENQAHGLRHIFLEEAAEFAPQKVTDGVTYAEIEKLARMGGNARLGYTLINQRSQEIAKAVLELCENVFLHRQRGKNSLENMDKWLSIAGSAQQKEIIAALPDMPQGQCYAWIGGDKPQPPMLVKVPTKNSLHPDRRVMRGDQIAGAKPAINVTKFVDSMRTGLAKFEEEAKANDPALLRKQIADLTRQLTQAGKAGNPVDPAALRQAEQAALARGHTEMRSAFANIAATLFMDIGEIEQAFKRLASIQGELAKLAQKAKPRADIRTRAPADDKLAIIKGELTIEMPKAQRRILTALAQHAGRRTKQQIAILTGYAIGGGGFNNALGWLRTRDFIRGGDDIELTDEGREALGPYEPLPHGAALLDHWRSQIGKAERSVLDALAAVHPNSMSKERLASEAGYAHNGGGFNNALGRLRSLELISGKHDLVASEHLFG